jgi:hypothetical protein
LQILQGHHSSWLDDEFGLEARENMVVANVNGVEGRLQRASSCGAVILASQDGHPRQEVVTDKARRTVVVGIHDPDEIG